MMEFNKDLEDRYTYPLMPQEHRWIYNKLSVAEMMGYNCCPLGTPIKKPGFYCIRPVMACAGQGSGGFLKFHAKQTQTGIDQPEYRAGYFWCEWFTGWHAWTNFVNDEPVYECGGRLHNNEIIMQYKSNITFEELPESLRGISKYMVLEHIEGSVIEISPRQMTIEYNYTPTKMVQETSEEFGNEWNMYKII